MRLKRLNMMNALLAGLAAMTLADASMAQDAAGYPNRPVRLVVPFVPGGTADTIARIVSDKLHLRLDMEI